MDDGVKGRAMSETTISRNWLAKMLLFMVAFIGLGIWGLIDATVVYPARGETYAEYTEFKYLESMDATGQILRSSVDDPKTALRDLRDRSRELREEFNSLPADGMARARVEAELDRYAWLDALATIGRATPARTTIEAPGERLEELRAEWATKEQPKKLSGFDLPMQWVFVAIGAIGGIWMGLTIMKVVKTKYRYEESTRTLTLPSGESFSPDQIVEVDKRKWDKFFVTVKLEDGTSHKLDLLRYQPLEEWILEMEKHSPNYEPPEEGEAGAEAVEPAPAEDEGARPE